MKLPWILALTATGLAATLPFRDPLEAEKLSARRPVRGEWKIANGVATCTQDDEVYKKFKNHGPVAWYDVPFSDATIRFSYKPEASKTFVFTANGEKGHVFRFVTSASGTDLRAFPPGQTTPPSIVLQKGGPALAEGWVDVAVELRGTKAVVRIGSWSAAVEHPSLARPKTNIGLGFSFGTVSIKNVSIEP